MEKSIGQAKERDAKLHWPLWNALLPTHLNGQYFYGVSIM